MDVTRVLAEARGYFTRPEALDLGLHDADLTAGVRDGVFLRVRRGVYSYRDLWASYGETERHLVLCRAVLQQTEGDVVLSHSSGALAHGISCWGVDLDTVHVTRLDGGAGRLEAGVHHHRGLAFDQDVVEVDGLRVLTADRCAIEAACLGTSEQALVVLDSFLHVGLGSPDDLMRRYEAMDHWPDTRKLHVPVRMADGGSQSPGESRGRWLFRVWHIPPPLLQYAVHAPDGRLIGTSDWGWPEYGLLGEFDGRFKYGRLLKPGQDPGEVVFGEKVREEAMRESTGYGMVRLIWVDYDRPRVTIERLNRMLRRVA